MEADEFANVLIPEDVPVPGKYIAIKTTGNGNCLYNAISLSINGDERLAAKLRDQTAWELFQNQDEYFNHAYLVQCEKKTSISKNILLHYLLGDDTLEGRTLPEAFDHEVRKTFETNRWSSLLHVFACATVLQEDIVTVFPDVPLSHRPLMHGIVKPRMEKEPAIKVKNHTTPVVLLWSRDGTFDNDPSAVYNPNHVVSLQLESSIKDTIDDQTKANPSTQLKIQNFFRPLEKNSIENEPQVIINSTNVDDEVEEIQAEPPAKRSKPSGRLSAWQAQFKWLEIDRSEQSASKLKCSLCAASKKKNIFARGKPCLSSKKDDLVKHEKSIDHCSAKVEPSLRKDIKAARVNAFDGVKAAIVAQMATVLTQAKEGIPSSKNSKLLKMQIFNGVSSLKMLQSDQTHYQHNDSINEIYSVLAKVVKDDFRREIEESPYPFYGLELDEATDKADKSILIIFIRFINGNGELRCSFLGVQQLQRTDAEGIFQAALATLAEHNLPTNKMVGLATDGASVMTGIHQGVSTRFKRLIPHLVTVHCMAHRLQLVSEKAANCVPLITRYISVLNQFAKSLKFSPKFQRILEESKHLNNTKSKKIKQIFFTRWLSFVDSVQAMAGCISAVISALQVTAMERGLEGRAVLHGVAQQMGTVKFLLLTHFLADVVGVLGILSLQLQKKPIDYVEAKSGIDAAIVTIQALLTTPGPYMKSIEVPEAVDPSGFFIYEGHDFKDKEKDRKNVKEASQTFIEQLVDRLGATFPDSNALGAFEVFSPKHCTMMSQTAAFEKFEKLCTIYNLQLIDKSVATFEFQLLFQVLKQSRYSNLDAQEFLLKVIHPQRETYKQLSILAAISATLPITSVNCERGISNYNAIKTESRNSLNIETMNSLMWLYSESPDLQYFNFDIAFELWSKQKDRRGFAAIVKSAATSQ